MLGVVEKDKIISVIRITFTEFQRVVYSSIGIH